MFLSLALGHFRRHKLEALLCLFGVALGVAVVVAIDAAVEACVTSFRGAVDSVAERSTHAVFAADGSVIRDEQFIALARRGLPVPMAPVIERGVVVARADADPTLAGAVGKLMGVDVFAEKKLRSFTQMQSSLNKADLRRFLTEPGNVVLVKALADKLGVHEGDALRLTIGSRRVTARVDGVFEPTGVARTQLNDLIIADLSTAQELTQSLGSLDRIDVRLESPGDEAALAAALPKELALRSTRERETSMTDLIASYKLNLNALSLMASFVAVFIVYNSMLISVQQRGKSLGILRCLGAARGQLAGIYLTEAAIYATLGGLLGVGGGWLLSRVMVGYVATTINDLYAALRPAPVTLGWRELGKGMGLSAFSCLVGAIVPLLRAAGTPPVTAFQGTARDALTGRTARRMLALGLLFLAATIGIYFLPLTSPLVGFAMAALSALGFSLACPWLLRIACRAVAKIARPRQWLSIQMAGAGVARSLCITGVAVAATMLAMSMNVGVRTMVSCFRGALASWVEQRFAADVFIGAELLVNHKIDATIDPAVEAWVKRQPQTSEVVEYRGRNFPFAGKSTLVVGTNVEALLKTRSVPVKRTLGGAFDPASDVLISEPLAGRTKLAPGDTLTIDAPAGRQGFRVFAIFFDFGSERGQIMFDRPRYAAAWRDDGINSLHVRLKPGNDPARVTEQWTADLAPRYPVALNSFNGLRSEVMAVFDRTFKVTEILTWLAGGVAFCGLAGSLLAVSMARQRDYGVLAATGMSASQTAAWVVAQGLILSWLSAFVAAVAGTALAYVLAYVIQFRSFGWSIPTHPEPRFWLECFVLATVAALVAAVYPIYRLRGAPPAVTLRQE